VESEAEIDCRRSCAFKVPKKGKKKKRKKNPTCTRFGAARTPHRRRSAARARAAVTFFAPECPSGAIQLRWQDELGRVRGLITRPARIRRDGNADRMRPWPTQRRGCLDRGRTGACSPIRTCWHCASDVGGSDPLHGGGTFAARCVVNV